MQSINEPATESQLEQLRQLGFEPDRPLTQGEAAYLIGDYRHRPGAHAVADQPSQETTPCQAYQLRLAAEDARRSAERAGTVEAERCQRDLNFAVTRREEFWLDTCRDPAQMHARSPQIFHLYMKYGCQFVNPTREQIREILAALDTVMPTWDRDQPEFFYQTLELNFPELRRRL